MARRPSPSAKAGTTFKRMKDFAPPPQNSDDYGNFMGELLKAKNEIYAVAASSGFADLNLDGFARQITNDFFVALAAFMANKTIVTNLEHAYNPILAIEIVAELSKRQHNILEEIKLAKTNKQIAKSLGFSESTIHHEIGILLKRYDVSNRLELFDIDVKKDAI